MDFIEKIKLKAKQEKKVIVLPETMDERVLKAAEIVIKENLADIILIGNKEEIIKDNKILNQATIINPLTSNLTPKYIDRLVELRKEKGMSKEEATKLLLEDYMYFACMLVLDEKADGIVSGACHTSSNTLSIALKLIKNNHDNNIVSSFFIMDIPNCSYGENGIFIFADCGLNQNPTMEQLAEIAGTSAKSFENLVGTTPYVALLSHSTYGSSKHADVDKVIKATKLAKAAYPQYKIDGELQLDAAIIKDVAKTKAPNSVVAGKSNVLIFPNLDSGNIGYKLVERLAKAKAYGPLTQGISKPVNDLSRGCSIEDIVGVVAITVVQAQNNCKIP